MNVTMGGFTQTYTGNYSRIDVIVSGGNDSFDFSELSSVSVNFHGGNTGTTAPTPTACTTRCIRSFNATIQAKAPGAGASRLAREDADKAMGWLHKPSPPATRTPPR